MNKYALGNNIHEILKARKMTQGDLAKIAGVKYCSLSSWMSGRYIPSICVLHKIAKALNVTTDELLKGIDDV